MTAAPELESPVQPEPEPAWQPDGREPQVCLSSAARDLSCAGELAYEVTFTLNSQSQSQVIVWLYAASEPGGVFIIRWRWIMVHGSWTAGGWDAGSALFLDAQAADDAALEIAVSLARGEGHRFPGGSLGCLSWDGVPW